MKVLILSTIYPKPNKPSSGTFVHEQVKQLVKLGVDLRVICPIALTPPSRLFKPQKNWFDSWRQWFLSIQHIPQETVLDEIKVYYPKWVHLPKKFFIHWEGDLCFYFIKRLLKRIWRGWEWNIVHAHFVTPNGIAGEKIAKKYRVPLGISCLGNDLLHYAKGKMHIIRIKKALSFATFVICKSENLRQTAINFGAMPERVYKIWNGCSLTKFKLLKVADHNEILFVGQFIARKGLKYLIKAFSRLEDGQVNLRLIGYGELFPQIKKLVSRYELEDRVKFQGWVPHAEVPSFLGKAKVICLPSLWEGTPNVVMEALACGTPVVATNVGGIPEIVPSHCGILVPPKNCDALGNALDEALKRDWDREGIRKYAENNLSSEVQCKKIIKIYTEVLQKN